MNDYSSIEYIDMSQYTESEVSFDFSKAEVLYEGAVSAGDTISADEPCDDFFQYFSSGDIIAVFVRNIKTGTGGEALAIAEFGEEI